MFDAVKSVISLVLEAKDNASSVIDQTVDSVSRFNISTTALAAGGLVAMAGAMTTTLKSAYDFSSEVSGSMRQVEAQTGLTGTALAEFEGNAKAVFTANWGSSFTDVATSMTTVQTVTQLTGTHLEELTTRAIIMRDVFNVDVVESTRAANTAMENFGVSGSTIADLITVAFQRTGDPAGDLLDTINEYSADFAEAGFSADQFIATLIAGSEAGAFNLDKVADAIREGTTRMLDGSATTIAALDTIGLGADNVYQAIQNGSLTTQSAMFSAIDALEKMTDPIAQDAAGVALFGSMWEDMGKKAIFALNDAVTGLDTVEGATMRAGEAISIGLSATWEQFKRTAITALEPLGDLIADALTRATPHLAMLGEWLGTTIPAAITTTISWLTTARDWFGTLLPSAIADGTTTFTSLYLPVWQSLATTYHETVQPALSTFVEWVGTWLPQALTYGYEILQTGLMVGLTTLATFIADPLIPTIGALVAWLLTNIPAAVTAATNAYNEKLRPALDLVWAFITEKLLPTIEKMYTWLLTNIPAAVTAATNAYNEKLRPALDLVWAFITEKLLPTIEKVYTWLLTNIPASVTAAANAFSTGWNTIVSVINTAWGIIGGIFDKIQAFAAWLSGHVFKFNFQWPEPPSWWQPGSPIKYHTLLMDMYDWTQTHTITPKVEFPPLTTSAIDIQQKFSTTTPSLPLFSPAATSNSGGVVFHGDIYINDTATGEAFLHWLEVQTTPSAT